MTVTPSNPPESPWIPRPQTAHGERRACRKHNLAASGGPNREPSLAFVRLDGLREAVIRMVAAILKEQGIGSQEDEA